MLNFLRPTLNTLRQRTTQRAVTATSTTARRFGTTPPPATEEDNAKQPVFTKTLEDSDSKLGSPSPWAVFDAWGADGLPSEHEHDMAADLAMLSMEELAVGTDPDQAPNDDNVTDCLAAYDRVLQTKATSHLGYPYNLRYNHEELYPFMKYSINRFIM